MAWILDEFSESLSDPAAIFHALFIDDFLDETEDVQPAILTVAVKLYLTAEDGNDRLRRVISLATN
jgi:vesicle coat complex subunit